MTLEDAKTTAIREANLFGLSMSVYRLRAWPHGVYGVRVTSKLPADAITASVAEPPPRAPSPAEPDAQVEDTETNDGSQGSLFG
jgi:hypothetical protein